MERVLGAASAGPDSWSGLMVQVYLAGTTGGVSHEGHNLMVVPFNCARKVAAWLLLWGVVRVVLLWKHDAWLRCVVAWDARQ